MPGDVIGTYIFDQAKVSFKLQKGPIFTNLLLIDEINRNTPKTNSAILEAMQEGQVTITGETLPLPLPFMIIATQSPIEFHGVFPLPEVLVDRFLLSMNVDYPSAEEEVLIASRLGAPLNNKTAPTVSKDQFQHLIDQAKEVYMAPQVQSYIVELVQKTRQVTGISLGASPRASIALSRATRASALLRGRMFVTPDDVKQYAPLVLRHRLIPSASAGTASMDEVVKTILEETVVPQSAA